MENVRDYKKIIKYNQPSNTKYKIDNFQELGMHLAVLGITALINPLRVVDNTLLDFDIYVMIGIAALLIPLVFSPKKMEIYWRDGLILITVYVIFITITLN